VIASPLFLISARGTEFLARTQSHNLAWIEAKDVSFEHGAVSLIRVDGNGARTVVARFESGLPARSQAEVSA
jgi:hypothetical protein